MIRLLIVEDDPVTRKILSVSLSGKYECDEADSAEKALEKIKQTKYSVILSDVSLPEMNGLDLLQQISTVSPESIVVLITATNSVQGAINALRLGAFDYILKPFDLKQVEIAVEKALNQFNSKQLKTQQQFDLEQMVEEGKIELEKALDEVENSYHLTLKALVQALETRDLETHGHSERVVTFSLRLGYELVLDQTELRDLELGALLHDIGKIGVPDAILRKPAKLTEEEWEKMKLHPLHGQKVLRNISFLEGAAKVVAQHHEKWDGTGYPLGLSGEEIDFNARIFAVVDAFDALTSNRVYRRGCSYEEAVIELEKYAGKQFDPLIVEVFKNVPAQDWETLRKRSLRKKSEDNSLQTAISELVNSKHQSESALFDE